MARFDNLQDYVSSIDTEYRQALSTYEALKASQWISYYTAAAAFGYFIAIMFVFVFIRLEIDLRSLRDAVEATIIMPGRSGGDS